MLFRSTPFLYPSEISTLRLRSKGSAISVLSKWIFNFLVVMISPVAIANIGWRIYIVWAVLNFTFIFVVYFFYPESKLEQTMPLTTFCIEIYLLTYIHSSQGTHVGGDRQDLRGRRPYYPWSDGVRSKECAWSSSAAGQPER